MEADYLSVCNVVNVFGSGEIAHQVFPSFSYEKYYGKTASQVIFPLFFYPKNAFVWRFYISYNETSPITLSY